MAAAQSPLMDHQLASAVWFDAQVPNLSAGAPRSVLIMNPGLRIGITPGATWSLVAEMPFVTATSPSTILGPGTSATLPGNPYVGVRITRGPRWYDLGVRLPVAKPDSASRNYPDSAGVFGDFERHEAYEPDLAAFSAGLTQASFSGPRGFGTRFTLTGNVDVPVRTRSGQRTNLYASADILVGYLQPWLAALIGVNVNARLNNSTTIYGEAISEQLLAGVILRTRNVRPTLGLRIPLSSDLSRYTKTVFQAGLTIGR